MNTTTALSGAPHGTGIVAHWAGKAFSPEKQTARIALSQFYCKHRAYHFFLFFFYGGGSVVMLSAGFSKGGVYSTASRWIQEVTLLGKVS